MNKSEIIAQAKIAEAGWGNADYVQIEAGRLALIAAARLLEMVEVLEEGSEPMVGDYITLRPNDPNSIPHKYYGKSNYIDEQHYAQIHILMRAGKPVITKLTEK